MSHLDERSAILEIRRLCEDVLVSAPVETDVMDATSRIDLYVVGPSIGGIVD